MLRDEDLQDNASRVGGHLKTRLLALRDRHPIIGTVHGIGLYLGVEMIRDRRRHWRPRPEETAAICDRMLDLGVVIQPTGDHLNILKTKPPLCIDVEAPTSMSTRWTGCSPKAGETRRLSASRRKIARISEKSCEFLSARQA